MRISHVLGTALLLASSALAAPVTYFGILAGANENPPVVTPGSGFALVTIDTAAHTLFVSASFQDLVGTTTAAHIHCCQTPPTNAGVATQTPSFVGFPLGVTFGSFNNTYDLTLAASWNAAFVTANGGTVAGAEAALAAGLAAGRAYLNIHTSFVGSGEIRDILEPVPEPSTCMLAGAALIGLVLLRRR
jgi:hypothetical protein